MSSTNDSVREKRVQVVPLRTMFEAFCQAHPIADIIDIYLLAFSQLNKWFLEAKVIDMSRVTTTDAFLCFFQFQKSAIDYEEFLIFLDDLTEIKNLDIDDVKYKLQTCIKPTSNENIGPKNKS